MKNIIFHLSTCNTCQRILGELGGLEGVEIQNVKEKHITAEELDFAKEKVGSYEGLFNKRAMKYRSMGLNKEALTEEEWRKHILAEYTFMKRPLAIINDEVFAGNAKKTVAALKEAVNG
ncbi:MAG: arsenate reductase [Saprospiraceae bacterium]|nr:arsenate reductase [Saprospiraceae bacterium]